MASALTTIGSGGIKAGMGIFAKLKYAFLIILFSVIFINSIILSIEERSIEPFIKEMGNRFILVTNNLAIESQKIIDNGNIYVDTGNFLKDIWVSFSLLSGILSSLYIIFIWFLLITFIARHLISYEPYVTYIIFLLVFFGLQIIFIKIYEDLPITTPFLSIYTFFKSIPYIIKPIVNLFNKTL